MMDFRNPDLPIEGRVADLVSRLTLEEKVSLLSETAPEIPRLGIRKYYHGNEALHGVVRPGQATVFPQAIALAATWDPELILQVATAISDEARAKDNKNKGEMAGTQFGGRYCGLLTFWSPTVNMARDPRWGRTAETYGEDPHLTGRIGVAFVKGLQGDDPQYLKTVSTPKHFVANNEEHNRFECKAAISDRALHEYYLAGFRACVIEGKAQAVMSAYSAINGTPCTGNRTLLTDLLRDEWGFDGYVVTDCGAISHMLDRHGFVQTPEEAAAAAIHAGVDLECGSFGTIQQVLQKHLIPALEQGLVTQAEIDQSVTRVLTARFRLGMFDPPERVAYTQISFEVVGSAEHVALARQSARESIVLLKNEALGGTALLPLDKASLRSLAVIGPNAAICQFGDYSGEPVHDPVSPLAGILQQAEGQIRVQHVPWETRDVKASPIPLEHLFLPGGRGAHGLYGEVFADAALDGVPSSTRRDDGIDFDWANQPPDPHILTERFSVRWTGQLIPRVSGDHELALTVSGGARVTVDGQLLIDRWVPQPLSRHTITVGLQAGQASALQVEFAKGEGPAVICLEWIQPAHEQAFERELCAASSCDAVIAFLGLGKTIEREGRDKPDLDLPADQRALIRQVYQANPKTIVVLINGSPLSIEWIDQHVPAIVEAWYPGEQGGHAIADVLFGEHNPAGRLPLTFYRSTDQLLPFDDYEISRGRTYMHLEERPLYPFGHGLSYTTFAYSELVIQPNRAGDSETVTVSVKVRNTGERDGDEVVQLYVRQPASSVKQPKQQLRGFRRIRLARGEQKEVLIPLAIRDLAFYHAQRRAFVVEPGEFEIRVGASSEDIRLTGNLQIVDEGEQPL